MAIQETTEKAHAEDVRERESFMGMWGWWSDRYWDLLDQYPEQWVLIDTERRILGAYQTLAEVRRAAEEQGIALGKDGDTKLITADVSWHL